MKKLEFKEMENVQGGNRPTGQQVGCYVAATIIGLCNPIAGIIAGGICLWA